MVRFGEVLNYFEGLPFDLISDFENYSYCQNEFENPKNILAINFHYASNEKTNEAKKLMKNTIKRYSRWKFGSSKEKKLSNEQKVKLVNDIYHACQIVDQNSTRPKRYVFEKTNEKTVRYIEQTFFEDIAYLMNVCNINPRGLTHYDYFKHLDNLQKQTISQDIRVENPFKLLSEENSRDIFNINTITELSLGLFPKTIGLTALLDNNESEFDEILGYYKQIHKSTKYYDLLMYAKIADFGEKLVIIDKNNKLPWGNAMRNIARYSRKKKNG